MFNQKIKRREEVLMFNEMNIKDMLCDMYDIRRKTKQAKLFNVSIEFFISSCSLTKSSLFLFRVLFSGNPFFVLFSHLCFFL